MTQRHFPAAKFDDTAGFTMDETDPCFHEERNSKGTICDLYAPIGSMYAIYGNIYHQYVPNAIHGSYGVYRERNPK